MTVPRGPTRRPTAGDPWAGARKSRVRPGVHGECDESERLVCGRGQPCRTGGAAGPAECVAQGVCSGGHSSPVLSRVPGGQGRESRGCRGSQDQAETGRLSAPPRASGRGRRPSPAVGLWRQRRCLGPTAWGQARPPCPRSLTSVKAQDAQRVSPTAPQRSILALACPRLSRPFPGWQLGRQRWGGGGSVHQVPNTIWGQPSLSPPPPCDQREQGSCRPQSSGRMGGSSLGCPVLKSQQPRPVSRGVCLDQRGHLPWPVTC